MATLVGDGKVDALRLLPVAQRAVVEMDAVIGGHGRALAFVAMS
ncbi:MAG: hypothetical protein U5L06_12875 [Rhodovibrio sp.]|nr:hypothetical protein [Rhodovibrio sp.]